MHTVLSVAREEAFNNGFDRSMEEQVVSELRCSLRVLGLFIRSGVLNWSTESSTRAIWIELATLDSIKDPLKLSQ